MSRQLRLEFPGSLWHITHRGNERRPIFADDNDRARFIELLGKAAERFRWIVTTYALMPNHYHFVVELTADHTLSRGIQWLDGGYAQAFNWRHDRVGHLYQGRFRAILVNQESHALEVLRYVVLNPVRGNIVPRPEAYEWSSHRAVLGLAAAPKWLAVDRVLAQFSERRDVARRRYASFVDEGIGSTRCPWDELIADTFLGPESWAEELRGRIESKPRDAEIPAGQRMPGNPTMGRVIAAVAHGFGIDEERIRRGRGGYPRMAAAWLAWNDANLRRDEIAAALRLRSGGRVTQLVGACETHLRTNVSLQTCLDKCIATLRRKN